MVFVSTSSAVEDGNRWKRILEKYTMVPQQSCKVKGYISLDLDKISSEERSSGNDEHGRLNLINRVRTSAIM